MLLFIPAMSCSRSGGTAIDREKLVHRHLPRLHEADPLSPFTVGNGEFAFTADITGLQTFPDFYEKGIPLATQSNWGWHTIPNSRNYTLEDATAIWDAYGRQVPYASLQHTEAGQWLRANPHRLHLGRIGFRLLDSAGNEIPISDLKNISQTVDLWQGILKSHFEIGDESVDVETACHPAVDQISVRIKSSLLQTGQIGIRFDFPYGSTAWGNNPADWTSPDAHRSEITFQDSQIVTIERTLDADRYLAVFQWSGDAVLSRNAEHAFLLSNPSTDRLEFNAYFLKRVANEPAPSTTETFAASKAHWRNFWESGGAVDLSLSKDPRAQELERRIVLSQYLTAVQCSGHLPPAETGLTFNSWYGKFHLEMHWWHGVHFALWGRPEVLERSLSWYRSIMPGAKETAGKQGYEGVRWPKMVSADGREGPSSVGVFLIWQQPHPIYYAELIYRLHKDPALLEKYSDIVFATADFMASYAHRDESAGLYNLGPPLIPAQEIHRPEETVNPTFELAYWKYGLKTAQLWRERLGLPRNEKWDPVLQHLPPLPQKNGLYQNAATAPDTFENAGQRRDHPTLLGAFGMLPGDSVDVEIMRNTLRQVMQSWNWESTWGWDYPMIAMTAARVGAPEMAIEALMMDAPKNRYLNNGHNYQDDRLPIYLPGNGGLLTAVAMMAAGWDGAPDVDAPGFPKDGNWVVKHEGLYPLP
ncbi:MAG: glycoside hydrolase family 65 [Acidobacteria bacterium]|nr:glycoside hydrolase family 65 [Acidobacteriota bacterium]